MNNKSLKSLLQQRAEQMAPTPQINLWPSIQAHLSSSNAVPPVSNGGSKMKTSTRSYPILGSISLAIILALIIMAFTPQGRALAQQFLSLFFSTEPDVRSLDPDTGPAVITPAANIQEIENLTHWHVSVPTWLPEGFGLNSADYRPENEMVVQAYGYQQTTDMKAGYFYLGQRKTPFTWPVGESAQIETVQIGDSTGEYVVGAWGGAEDHQEWENNPAIQHLRWQANGTYFDIQFNIMGVDEADFADSPYYLSKDQLINIANHVK